MKKIIIFIMMLMPAAGLFSLPMMIGIEGNLGNIFQSMSSSNSTIGSVTTRTYLETFYTEITPKLFFDATYFRLDVGYMVCILPMQQFNISNDVKYVYGAGGTTPKPFNYTYLTIGAMGKLPVEFSSKASMWFGLGLEYAINLTLDSDSDGTNDMAYGTNGSKISGDLNDLYAVAAVGFTINLNENIAIVPSVKFKYDLTPFIYSEAYLTDPEGLNLTAEQVQLYKDDNKFFILNYEIGLGIALKL